jgi:Pro-kumamolisin, activation domain
MRFLLQRFSFRHSLSRSLTVLIAILMAAAPTGWAQAVHQINRIIDPVNPAQVVALANHHPQWASRANNTGPVPPNQPMEQLTLVLARSPQQEAALQTLLSEQQDSGSPNYHHWLTPAEMGERFGVSDQDVATLSSWLQAQGLHVNWVSPSHLFIRFGGAAKDVGKAFRTELHTYNTRDGERFSASSDPIIPAALKPAIRAIHGLYTIHDHPLHSSRKLQSETPKLTLIGGNVDHVIVPGDFRAIYGLSNLATGAMTIGILGQSRTNFDDFANFRALFNGGPPNPTEVIPTQFGGVDPGPAYTAPPAGTVSLDDQSEATLDVVQAGGFAATSPILLVSSTAASGGIETDAQYLVQTSPIPAQVITISYGACESAVGPAGVAFWDTLFQQASAEGISVFVSSGDSGAAGCDQDFTTPPETPQPISPNYICSSSYATCVGGTELNDTTDSATYWNPGTDPTLALAVGYIPEGAWNDPFDKNNNPQVASSGGGVSTVIATPAWQTGAGVPSARTGRYTPDVAFSAAEHDGYFGCFAAGGGSCVRAASGSLGFFAYYGTSAAAPLMAAVAGLVDTAMQAPQGNLNPQLYGLAVSAPEVFHDVTVATSGVTGCDVATPSMCNNSIPSPTGLSGGEPGYLVTDGYDVVTGLGSLNILNFLQSFQGPPTIVVLTPPVQFPPQLLGFPNTASVEIKNGGSGSLDPLSLSLAGADAGDFTVDNPCQPFPPSPAKCSVTVTFTPSAVGGRTANLVVTAPGASNSPFLLALGGSGTDTRFVPTVSIDPKVGTIDTTQALPLTITVTPVGGVPLNKAGTQVLPTGSVLVSGGGYSSAPLPLTNTTATVTIPAGALGPVGNLGLTATYTPDSAAAAVYSSASAAEDITVTQATLPSFSVAATPLTISPGATTGNTSPVTIAPAYGFTGSVTLTAVITSGPANAQHAPTFSFGSTSPALLTNFQGTSATLTVTTTAPVTSTVRAQSGRLGWYTAGGISLAWLCLLGIPKRSRAWLGLVLLCVTLYGMMTACGGSGSHSIAPIAPNSPTQSDPGTTAGVYMVTITGTSGSTTASDNIGIQVR